MGLIRVVNKVNVVLVNVNAVVVLKLEGRFLLNTSL